MFKLPTTVIMLCLEICSCGLAFVERKACPASIGCRWVRPEQHLPLPGRKGPGLERAESAAMQMSDLPALVGEHAFHLVILALDEFQCGVVGVPQDERCGQTRFVLAFQ